MQTIVFGRHRGRSHGDRQPGSRSDGGNPIGGFSHATSKLDELMRQYFTFERTADLLVHAEEQGITAFQSH